MSGAAGASPGLQAAWARGGLAPVRGHPEGFIELGQQQPQLHLVGNGGQLHGQVVWTVTAEARKGTWGGWAGDPVPPDPEIHPQTHQGGRREPSPAPASGFYFASEEAGEVPSPGGSLEHRCWTLGRGLPRWSRPPAPQLVGGQRGTQCLGQQLASLPLQGNPSAPESAGRSSVPVGPTRDVTTPSEKGGATWPSPTTDSLMETEMLTFTPWAPGPASALLPGGCPHSNPVTRLEIPRTPSLSQPSPGHLPSLGGGGAWGGEAGTVTLGRAGGQSGGRLKSGQHCPQLHLQGGEGGFQVPPSLRSRPAPSPRPRPNG